MSTVDETEVRNFWIGVWKEILGRKVDLNTPQCLSRYFREEVLAEGDGLRAGVEQDAAVEALAGDLGE